MKTLERNLNSIGKLLILGMLLASVGCANRVADTLNPFGEENEGNLGVRNSTTLLGDGSGSHADRARHALEVMRSYRTAQTPQPAYPVVQPAEVRLMWVPDHLNRAGDLVPAHYYYLRVLNDRWAVQDAFELEDQLETRGNGTTATPWVFGGDR